ncbi:right-handed parallel beta-helix repeat-containing protein [Candidatus Omnitrophota bacterium]
MKQWRGSSVLEIAFSAKRLKSKTKEAGLIKRIKALLLLLLIFLLSLSSLSFASEETHLPSKVRLFAGGGSSSRGIFYLDYLLPLYYSEDQTTLLFFNPKVNIFYPSSDEQNLGVGFRKSFLDKFILGLHFFWDRKSSPANAEHRQLGYGAEFLSQHLDLRFNYYNPLTSAQCVDTNYELGGTSLVQFNQLEESLEGFDFEIGGPLLEKYTRTRFYAGGFFYQSKLAKDVNGARLRTETNFLDWLSLDTTIDLRSCGEVEFTAGIRVTIPLELGRILYEEDPHEENPFKTIPRDSPTKERLFERVVRDIDVQTSANPIPVKSDVSGIEMIYVDNTAAAGGDGSLTTPYNTLAAALASARYIGNGGTANYVYVFRGNGTYTGYQGNFTLDDNVTLWGSGYDGGCKGIPVLGYPIIDGNNSGNVITLADNNTIMGCQIQGSGDDTWLAGIYGINVSAANINHNNIIDNGDTGIFLKFTDALRHSDFIFTGNTVSGNGAGGIFMFNQAAGTISDFTFTGNTVTENTGVGIYMYNDGGGTISDFTFTGNTLSGNTLVGAIYFFNYNASTISDFTFTGNTIIANPLVSGIALDNFNDGNSVSDFTFTDNTISGNTYGILFDNFSFAGDASAVSDFTFTGNTITGNANNGVYLVNLELASGTFSDFTFTGNTITGNTQNGILLDKGLGAISGINLGNGSAGGNNSLYDNGDGSTYFDINNDSGIDLLSAQYNWWGQAEPDSDQFGGDNTVDYTQPLASAP